MPRGQASAEAETNSTKREATFDAFRRWGYLQADLDPLGDLQPVAMPELEITGKDATAARAFYCGTIGAEFMHIPDADRRRWIAQRMESEAPAPDREYILERLVRADIFEQVLQTRYLGTKRYSLEGDSALIPLLDSILEAGSSLGAEQGVVAMSHRGRLNVMVHTIGRAAAEVFARFEDVDPRSVLGGGDVKYHLGATGEFLTPAGRRIAMHLVSNPSHLEAVDPVAMGRARAKQTRIGAEGRRRVLPIILHGDAAFAGQGIWAETLNHGRRRRLLGRRLRPHHRQQSDRLHHGSRRIAFLALLLRSRQAPADSRSSTSMPKIPMPSSASAASPPITATNSRARW